MTTQLTNKENKQIINKQIGSSSSAGNNFSYLTGHVSFQILFWPDMLQLWSDTNNLLA